MRNDLIYKFTYWTFILTLSLGWSACNFSSGSYTKLCSNRGYVFRKSDSGILIDHVKNYCKIRKPFTLTTTQNVKISACGEIISGQDNGRRDVFEIYIDKLDNKVMKFDSRNHKFLFFSEIGGSSEGTEVVFETIDINSYFIEIALPWKSLEISPKNGKFLGFDFAFSDNDNGFEQGKQVAWHANDSDIWLDPRLWGHLQLVQGEGLVSINDSIVFSVQQKAGPKLDGKLDLCWQNAPVYHANKVLYGNTIKGQTIPDISVSLRSLWNQYGVYFLVEVQDNMVIKKSSMGKVFDHGWIESATGQVIWDLKRSNVKHSGGALKNGCADTVLMLMAGNYFLCYQSDESHAYGRWDDTPPDNKLYGIEIRF